MGSRHPRLFATVRALCYLDDGVVRAVERLHEAYVVVQVPRLVLELVAVWGEDNSGQGMESAQQGTEF